MFDGALADEFVDDDVLLLADAEGAVGGLVFDGGVPPAVEVDDVAGGGEVEAGAASFDADDHEGWAAGLLEGFDEFGALLHAGAAVQDEAFATKHRAQVAGERIAGFLELREDEGAFAFLGEFAADLGEAGELAAIGGSPRTIAVPVAGVVADLLELEQEAEHEALSLDRLHGFVGEHLRELIDELRVNRRLAFGEAAEGLQLDLVRQIADDAAIGLHAAQDVGPHEPTQRRVAFAGLRAVFHGIGEGGAAAEQAGIEEIEEAPEIAGTVFDWRAGQSDAHGGLQGLHRLRGAAAAVFDGLRFIENDHAPGVREPGVGPLQELIGRDHHIEVTQRLRRMPGGQCERFAIGLRGVCDEET